MLNFVTIAQLDDNTSDITVHETHGHTYSVAQCENTTYSKLVQTEFPLC